MWFHIALRKEMKEYWGEEGMWTNAPILVVATVWQIPALLQGDSELWAASIGAPRKKTEVFSSDLCQCFGSGCGFGTKAAVLLWRTSTKSQWRLWQYWLFACVNLASCTHGMWLLQTPLYNLLLPLLIAGHWKSTDWKCSPLILRPCISWKPKDCILNMLHICNQCTLHLKGENWHYEGLPY